MTDKEFRCQKKCPVCDAEPGEPCQPLRDDDIAGGNVFHGPRPFNRVLTPADIAEIKAFWFPK